MHKHTRTFGKHLPEIKYVFQVTVKIVEFAKIVCYSSNVISYELGTKLNSSARIISIKTAILQSLDLLFQT